MCLPLGELIDKDVGWAEEDDLGSCGPPLDEASVDLASARILELLENRLHVSLCIY